MYRKTLISLGMMLTILTLVACKASSAPITFNFTGEVRSVPNQLLAEFSSGETISGSYTFESAIEYYDPWYALRGQYREAISHFSATIGGDYTVGLGVPGSIYVSSSTSQSSYTVTFANLTAPYVAGRRVSTFALVLSSWTNGIFDSNALPITPPDISQLEHDFSNLTFANDKGQHLAMSFKVTSITQIPEPTTSALALTAVLFIFGRRRTF